jgi:hypothetical protein
VASYLGGVWNPRELGRTIAQATGGGVNEWLNIIEQPPPEGMDGLGLFTLHDNKQRGPQRKLSISLTSEGRQVVAKYCAAEGIPNVLAEEAEPQRGGASSAVPPEDTKQDQNSFPTEPESDVLEREFGEETAASPMDADAALYGRANELAAEGLAALMARYRSEPQSEPAQANTKFQSVRMYKRSALVVAIARLLADNSCEVPNCNHPTFLDKTAFPTPKCITLSRYLRVGRMFWRTWLACARLTIVKFIWV